MTKNKKLIISKKIGKKEEKSKKVINKAFFQ